MDDEDDLNIPSLSAQVCCSVYCPTDENDIADISSPVLSLPDIITQNDSTLDNGGSVSSLSDEEAAHAENYACHYGNLDGISEGDAPAMEAEGTLLERSVSVEETTLQAESSSWGEFPSMPTNGETQRSQLESDQELSDSDSPDLLRLVSLDGKHSQPASFPCDDAKSPECIHARAIKGDGEFRPTGMEDQEVIAQSTKETLDDVLEKPAASTQCSPSGASSSQSLFHAFSSQEDDMDRVYSANNSDSDNTKDEAAPLNIRHCAQSFSILGGSGFSNPSKQSRRESQTVESCSIDGVWSVMLYVKSLYIPWWPGCLVLGDVEEGLASLPSPPVSIWKESSMSRCSCSVLIGLS